MSALTPKADMWGALAKVFYGPNSGHCRLNVLFGTSAYRKAQLELGSFDLGPARVRVFFLVTPNHAACRRAEPSRVTRVVASNTTHDGSLEATLSLRRRCTES
jgi:hypothetical protein